MEVQDIGLVRPEIISLAVAMTTEKVMKKKLLKCLRVTKVIDIGILIPSTIPEEIVEVMKVLDLGLKRPATIPQLIAEVVDIGQV